MKVRTKQQSDYITPYKVYEAKIIGQNNNVILFSIVNDNQNTIDCLNKNCGHLGGENWEIL